jgi:hypothetical protein
LQSTSSRSAASFLKSMGRDHAVGDTHGNQLLDRSPITHTHASASPLATTSLFTGKVCHLELHGKQCRPVGIQPDGQKLDEAITDPEGPRS